jgi:Zn-dependent protease
MTRPAFHVRGIPVLIPPSAAIGFGLFSWLALPSAESMVGTGFASTALALTYGAAIYCAIFIHEFGHALAAQKRGYEVNEIVLHIFGGHTLFAQKFAKPSHLGWISFAGPLFNLLTAICVFAFIHFTPDGLISSVLSWLLWSTTAMGIINLLPGIPLDGGAILNAVVWKVTGNEVTGKKVASLAGIGVAILWIFSPFLLSIAFGFSVTSTDVFISATVGMWLGTGAWLSFKSTSQPLAANNIEATHALPVMSLKEITRRAVTVDVSTTCSDAIAAAEREGAGAIVVVKGGQLIGIVRNAALAAVPENVRASQEIGIVSRQIGSTDRIAVDSTTEQILQLLGNLALQEWLVVDEFGRLVGVLQRSDVEEFWRSHGSV